MASARVMYRAVVCGVNESVGQTPLKYAESDASAIFRTFTGALGPARENASALLLGQRASRSNVLRILRKVAEIRTDYLLFYFSGHGSDDGIALADEILYYWELHQELEQIGARAMLVILDACHSGAYAIWETAGIGVGDVEASWATVLAAAMPGTRMFFAARPEENSAEGGDVPGGHFTWALLEALHRAKGRIPVGGQRFVSDAEAFQRASAYLSKRWPNDAAPACQHLSGDFPMLRSHAEYGIGWGTLSIHPQRRGYVAEVDVRIFERTGVPMHLTCRLLDDSGTQFAKKTLRLVPSKSEDDGVYQFKFPRSALSYEAINMLDAGYPVRLRWEATLVDPYHGYTLDQASQYMTYRRTQQYVFL